MFFEPLAVLASTLSIAHLALGEQILENVILITANDNAKPWVNEEFVEKRLNVKIRVGEERATFWEKYEKTKPKKGANGRTQRGTEEIKESELPAKNRHFNLAKILKKRYAALKLETNLMFEVGDRGASRVAAENIFKGLEMQGEFQPRKMTYDATNIFVGASRSCPRFAMEYMQSENTNPAPQYEGFKALIKYIMDKYLEKNGPLEGTAIAYDHSVHFHNWQFASLYLSWSDFRDQDVLQMPKWLKEDPYVIEQFEKNVDEFMAAYYGRYFTYNSKVAMACGPLLRQLTLLLSNDENVAIHTQESISRCAFAAIGGAENMKDHKFRYGATFLIEKYSNPDSQEKRIMIYFASSPEALEASEEKLIVDKSLNQFVAELEERFIPRKWSIQETPEEKKIREERSQGKREERKTAEQVANEVFSRMLAEIEKDETKGMCYTLPFHQFDTVKSTNVQVMPLQPYGPGIKIKEQIPLSGEDAFKLLVAYGTAFPGGPQGGIPEDPHRSIENQSVLEGTSGVEMEMDMERETVQI